MDLSHGFSTRQGVPTGGKLFGFPTWRYRVLRAALRLRPRRALSSASGQKTNVAHGHLIRQKILKQSLLAVDKPHTCFVVLCREGMRFVWSGFGILGQHLQEGRNGATIRACWSMLTSRWAYGRCSRQRIGVTLRCR